MMMMMMMKMITMRIHQILDYTVSTLYILLKGALVNVFCFDVGDLMLSSSPSSEPVENCEDVCAS